MIASFVVLCGMGPACDPRGSCFPEVSAPGDLGSVVEDGYASFLSSLRLPLCVRKIDVVDEGIKGKGPPRSYEGPAEFDGRIRDRLGRYSIQLRAIGDLAYFRGVLVHELCHAASYQHDLVRDAPPIPFADGVAEGGWREEALAQWCQLGSLGVVLVGDAGELSAAEKAVNDYLQATLYEVRPEADTLEVVYPTTVWPIEVELSWSDPFAGFSDEGLLVFNTAEEPERLSLDPYTGEVVEGFVHAEYGHGNDLPLASGIGWWDNHEWFDRGSYSVGIGTPTIPTGRDGRAIQATFVVEEGRAPSVLRGASNGGTVLAKTAGDELYQVEYNKDTWEVTLTAWALP